MPLRPAATAKRMQHASERAPPAGRIRHPYLLTLYCTSSVTTLPSASPAASIEELWLALKLASAVTATPFPAQVQRRKVYLLAVQALEAGFIQGEKAKLHNLHRARPPRRPAAG